MKYAKFSDDFLSDFRLDDNRETLVLTDKRGYTRAVKLLTYKERPKGKWVVFYTLKKKKVFKCDKCMAVSIQGQTNFCPNCGADMRKGGAE